MLTLLHQKPSSGCLGRGIGNEFANSDGESFRLKRLDRSDLLIGRVKADGFGCDLNDQVRTGLPSYGCDGSPIQVWIKRMAALGIPDMQVDHGGPGLLAAGRRGSDLRWGTGRR